MTKNVTALKDVEVHYLRGATPETILLYLQSNLANLLHLWHPEAIVIHAGINYLGTKDEWTLYLNFINGKLFEANYSGSMKLLTPLPANGTTILDTFQGIINLICTMNQEVTILISAIIPSSWDFE